jgi:hypothetical protein
VRARSDGIRAGRLGINVALYVKGEAVGMNRLNADNYSGGTPVGTDAFFYANKLKAGHYYFTIFFNPFDINKLRNSNSPIKFEYTIEIEKKGEIILKRTYSFFLEKATTGRGDFLFDIPGSFFVDDDIQISVKDIVFDTLFSQYYEYFYFELQRNPLFSLR